MIYLLKNKDKKYMPSIAGERVKTVYKLDTYKYELVKVGEVDLQDKIQSYSSMTNYKELIDKLHSPEEMEQFFPVNINALYADVSAFSSHYMENQELFKNVLNVIDSVRQQQEVPKKQEQPQEQKEEIKNGE